mgnify:CR=1 FL=1
MIIKSFSFSQIFACSLTSIFKRKFQVQEKISLENACYCSEQAKIWENEKDFVILLF